MSQKRYRLSLVLGSILIDVCNIRLNLCAVNAEISQSSVIQALEGAASVAHLHVLYKAANKAIGDAALILD